jgi:hypothetical protein
MRQTTSERMKRYLAVRQGGTDNYRILLSPPSSHKAMNDAANMIYLQKGDRFFIILPAWVLCAYNVIAVDEK